MTQIEENLQLVDAQTGTVIVPQLELAATFWARFRGLQFRKSLPTGTGLLIVPCRSVHTHWMRFPIDVVMLDTDGTVQKVQQNLRPWRTCGGPKGVRFVLEMVAGTANVRPQQRLQLKAATFEQIPKLLYPLCNFAPQTDFVR